MNPCSPPPIEQARRHKPCVVFIDELDALGGARVANALHPYSRMTLNQLLVELDGYKELEGVVVIGATNFPESLDKYVCEGGEGLRDVICTLLKHSVLIILFLLHVCILQGSDQTWSI